MPRWGETADTAGIIRADQITVNDANAYAFTPDRITLRVVAPLEPNPIDDAYAEEMAQAQAEWEAEQRMEAEEMRQEMVVDGDDIADVPLRAARYRVTAIPDMHWRPIEADHTPRAIREQFLRHYEGTFNRDPSVILREHIPPEINCHIVRLEERQAYRISATDRRTGNWVNYDLDMNIAVGDHNRAWETAAREILAILEGRHIATQMVDEWGNYCSLSESEKEDIASKVLAIADLASSGKNVVEQLYSLYNELNEEEDVSADQGGQPSSNGEDERPSI